MVSFGLDCSFEAYIVVFLTSRISNIGLVRLGMVGVILFRDEKMRHVMTAEFIPSGHILLFILFHIMQFPEIRGLFFNLITVTIIFLSMTTHSLITWQERPLRADSEGDSPLE